MTVSVKAVLKFLDAEKIDYRFFGSEECTIEKMSNIQNLENGSICWIRNEKYFTDEVRQDIASHKNVLVVAPFQIPDANVIVVAQPKNVFFPIANHFFDKPFAHSISARATVLSDKIGNHVHVGPGCFVGEDVSIGDNTILHPNVVIDCPCKIGSNCEFFPGVIIGADGYGYFTDKEHVPHREKHYKGVVIGDNVDIGANSCIDRGLLSDTVIEDHVKIDNCVHIAHNVVVGSSTMIVAGVVVCGSVKIGRNCYIAPGAILKNQITVGENTLIGMGVIADKPVGDNMVLGNRQNIVKVKKSRLDRL